MTDNNIDYTKRKRRHRIAFESGEPRERSACPKCGSILVKRRKLNRFNIFINGKEIRIKIKFSKPIKRSSTVEHCWEFTKISHKSRLWPNDIYHYYLLMGLNENGGVEKIWKVSTDDD